MSQASEPGIITSPLTLPNLPAISVPELIRSAAREHPADVAIVDAASGRSYTYGQFDQAIGRFAAGLTALGFRPGDVLALFAPNLPEWPIVALGTMAAGGAVTGVNPLYNERELEHQMKDSGASVVFTVPPFLETTRTAAKAAGCKQIILLGEAEGCVSFASVMANRDPEPAIAVTPDTLAALPYSSGTTGMAKGVILRHRNLVANVVQFNTSIVIEDSVSLAFLPMFHIFGFTVVTLAGLASGAKLVTIPRFEPEPFLQAIAQYRVTNLFVVPPIMQFLAAHPLVDQYDMSTVQMVGCGAAPLSAALEEAVARRLNCSALQGYGMTESSGVISVSSLDRRRPGSSGVLLAGTDARLIGAESGRDVNPGEAGELWFRGPQQFDGYLNNPEATAATITSDGWVRTGDIGRIDDDGFVYITDRLKELIKVKGFLVPPAELEALLLTHPNVADAGVVGRADERSGEIPVAYIVPRGELDPEALKQWVADQVVEYKQLGAVVITNEIPKNPSGKILHRILRDKDRAGT
jgi:acyl-CoA synthetase (AMP-forming)/AMP-acid ligase II